MTLFTLDFWQGIGWALLRTAIAGLVPFVPALLDDPEGVAPVAASTVGLLLIVAVLAALKGLPSTDGAFWWEVLASRGLRQFAQFAAAGVGVAVTLGDVDWQTVLTGAFASALSTVLIAALTLIPETAPAAEVEPLPYEPGHAIEEEV